MSKPRVESSPLWCSKSCISGENDAKLLYNILFIYLFCMHVSFIMIECKETLHEQLNDSLVSQWEYVTHNCTSWANIGIFNASWNKQPSSLSIPRESATLQISIQRSVRFTNTDTHTHVRFCEKWGHPIGVMVFILYKLYVLLPYTYPTPKLSPHRRLCISTFPKKTSPCMIYKRFEKWGHGSMSWKVTFTL